MGAKIGVKAATLGAIDAADFEGLKSVASDIAKETSTKADEYVESLLKLQSQERETFEGVRQTLSELAASFSEADDKNKKPLVFIIDELDRCKPTFALELLEKIKHIFSISNVHFILSTHLSQLESTVRYSYGSDVDARTYLQKFYNIVLHFPAAGLHRSERFLPKYFQYLSHVMSLDPDDLEIDSKYSRSQAAFAADGEKIVTCIAIARAFTPKNYLWLHPILSGLSVLKIIDAPLFRKTLQGNVSLDEINSAFAPKLWPEDNHRTSWMMDWWTYCLAENEGDFPELDWRSFGRNLFQYSIRDRRDIVRLMANHIDRLQIPQRS